MQLNQLLASKAYRLQSEDGLTVTFPTPQETVEPFLNLCGNSISNVEVQTVTGSVNVNDDGSENVAYSHVLLRGVLHANEEFTSKVLLLYRLDKQQKGIIAYGDYVNACMNMTIFNAKYKFETDVLRNGFSGLTRFLEENILPKHQQWREEQMAEVDRLKSTLLPEERLCNLLGLIGQEITKPKNKIPFDTGLFLAAMKHVNNPDCVWGKHRQDFSLWHLYNCFTEDIENKPMDTRVHKTLMVKKLIELA